MNRLKNDPLIFALLRGIAGSRTAKVVQIFNSAKIFLYCPTIWYRRELILYQVKHLKS